MNIFHVLFYEPIYNTIVIFYRLLGNNLGLAIISVALIARLLMIPLSIKQMQMAESGREFSEKMKAIKEKYKNNKEKTTKGINATTVSIFTITAGWLFTINFPTYILYKYL